jgi:hypothetical protein
MKLICGHALPLPNGSVLLVGSCHAKPADCVNQSLNMHPNPQTSTRDRTPNHTSGRPGD